MPRLALTPQTPVGPYPQLPLGALALTLAWTAAGAAFADGVGFPVTGRELLLVRNRNVAAQTVTISSVRDALNRTGDIAAYSIPAGGYAMFLPGLAGWQQADGQLYAAASAADVDFAVIRLPSLP